MDNGRVSYEEAVEAIQNWSKTEYEFYDDDVETIYANGRPIDMVRKQTRNTLTINVARLWANDYITLQDARIWCVNTNHSLVDMEQAVGSIRYSQTETTTIPAWYEKKRSWPYRLVAFLNKVIDMFVLAITEDFL